MLVCVKGFFSRGSIGSAMPVMPTKIRLRFNLSLHESPQEVIFVFVEQGLAKLGVLEHEFVGQIVELVLAVEK